MKLLYRGMPYEAHSQSIQNPSAPDGTSLEKVCLIYRGSTYEYQPQPQLVDQAPIADVSDASIVTLKYRGQAYQRKLSTPKPYQQPRALNWRWQLG